MIVWIGSVLRLGAAASLAAACLATAGADRAAALSVAHPCWQNIGGFVVVCDPVQLARNSARKTGPPLPATLRVSVPGYPTACILGLCQTGGDHLIPGQKIVFKGRLGRETYVTIFTAIHRADAWIVVRPRDLMMSGRSMVWTVTWREGMGPAADSRAVPTPPAGPVPPPFASVGIARLIPSRRSGGANLRREKPPFNGGFLRWPR